MTLTKPVFASAKELVAVAHAIRASAHSVSVKRLIIDIPLPVNGGERAY